MRWNKTDRSGRFTLNESIEIDEGVACVFAHWDRVEDFPLFMDSVRRTKRIDAERVLWDVDISGHQVVWEARIVERIPEKLIRWESSWGASHAGEARFEALVDERTRLTIAIEFRPQGRLERLGARIGLTDLQLRRDLERFRHYVERLPLDELARSKRAL